MAGLPVVHSFEYPDMMPYHGLVIPHDEFARQQQLSRLLRSQLSESPSPSDRRQDQAIEPARTTGKGERER